MEHLKNIDRFEFYKTVHKDQDRWLYYGYCKDWKIVDMKRMNWGDYTYKMQADWKPWRTKSIVSYDIETRI